MDNIKKNLNLFIDTLEKDFVVFLDVEQLDEKFLRKRIDTLGDVAPLSMYNFVIYEGKDGLTIKYFHEYRRICIFIRTGNIQGYKVHYRNLQTLNRLFKVVEEINRNFRNENKND